jgi:lipopolysaccharide/colanic/teichoic acid biosynthesis glycosyltransferase
MNGPIFKLRNDPRVTRTGRRLRRRHLDELPQFWNVLKGEMSLVGTRPPTENEAAVYSDHHQRRLSIKPGLTGLWQLSGNGAVKDFEEVVKLDCEYIDNWSLWLDFKIVARTIAKVVRGNAW